MAVGSDIEMESKAPADRGALRDVGPSRRRGKLQASFRQTVACPILGLLQKVELHVMLAGEHLLTNVAASESHAALSS